MQLIHAIPLIWKQRINDSEINVETNYIAQDHHLTENTSVIVFQKLTVREIYSVLLLSSGSTPTSQKYSRKVFTNEHFVGRKFIYYPE